MISKRLQKGLVSFLVGGLETVSSVWCQEAKPVLFKITYDSLELVSELFKSTLVALGVKNLPANAGDVWGMSLIPGKILWRRAQQITPVFLLEESHGQRSLGALRSIGSQRVRHDWSNLAHMGDCHIACCLLLQCSSVTDITCALLSIFFPPSVRKPMIFN